MPSNKSIFTIGHSIHSIQKFVGLLRQHEITAVGDVRSVPYSRMQPQFDREYLARVLKENAIAYVFLGKELGARSDDPACYENGRVQYRRLAQTTAFHAGLNRVRAGSENHKITLMCAEREPIECHRTLLISREIEDAGTKVIHIHADGNRELHEDAMRRLLQRLRLPEQDLFRSRDELIGEAYSRQEARIAYVDQQLAQEVPEA